MFLSIDKNNDYLSMDAHCPAGEHTMTSAGWQNLYERIANWIRGLGSQIHVKALPVRAKRKKTAPDEENQSAKIEKGI